MHLLEIFEKYFDSFSVQLEATDLKFQSIEITERDLTKFINTLHFGREGKLCFQQLPL